MQVAETMVGKVGMRQKWVFWSFLVKAITFKNPNLGLGYVKELLDAEMGYSEDDGALSEFQDGKKEAIKILARLDEWGVLSRLPKLSGSAVSKGTSVVGGVLGLQRVHAFLIETILERYNQIKLAKVALKTTDDSNLDADSEEATSKVLYRQGSELLTNLFLLLGLLKPSLCSSYIISTALVLLDALQMPDPVIKYGALCMIVEVMKVTESASAAEREVISQNMFGMNRIKGFEMVMELLIAMVNPPQAHAGVPLIHDKSNDARVRMQACTVIGLLAGRFTPTLASQLLESSGANTVRKRVINALESPLGDHKRVVRQAAGEARSKWFAKSY